MNIAGFKKHSLIDFPGYVASVVFTQGCNMSCGYCHNARLIPKQPMTQAKEAYLQEVREFLKSHASMLDAVVVSGGEPTLQRGLVPFLNYVKSLGLMVKLDTNGTNPRVLEQLIINKWVDFVSMDIKTVLHPGAYSDIGGKKCSPAMIERIKTSIKLIKHAGLGHEFRTTFIRQKHNEATLHEIASSVHSCQKFTLQCFDPSHVNDESYLQYQGFDWTHKEALKDIFSKSAGEVVVR